MAMAGSTHPTSSSKTTRKIVRSIMGRGGGNITEGVQVKFYPYKRGRGAGKVLAILI